jgi:hypothetical protein
VADGAAVGPVTCAADPGLAAELLERDGRPVSERVASRHDQIERVVQQVGALQLHGGGGQRLVVVDERQIELPAGDSGEQPLQMVVDDGRLDVGVSPAGLRRVARLGDGWVASAYNTTPDRLRQSLDHPSDTLRLLGRLPESFPNALATTWLHVTEDRASAERMLTDVLAPMLNRPAAALRSLPLPIGPAEVCAERLSAFVGAGARRIFVWPLGDAVAQLERFRERVVPLVQR